MEEPTMQEQPVQEQPVPGKPTEVPQEILRWNWGAFFLNWIWGIGNSTYIALLCLIPFVNIIMIFVLGAKGSEWAWQNRHWDSVEHFKRVQRAWAWWGFGLFLLGILIFIINTIVAVSTLQ